MTATFVGVFFLVIVTKLIKLLAVVLGMLLAVVLGMLSYVPELLPVVALAGALRYACRLLCHTWLRREWFDFIRQWFTTELECPICTEPVPATPWRVAELPCCQARVCWTCVRRHAESVIDDSRPEMHCPGFPCRRVLPDVFVSDAFRRERWQWSSPDILGTRELRKLRTYERWTLTAGLAANSSARME